MSATARLGTARQRSPSAAAASERADGFAGAAVRALAWNRTLWASLSRLGMREASVPPGPEWAGPPGHTRLRPLLLQPAEGVRGVRGVRRGVNEQCALTSSGSSSSVLALGLQRQATTGCHRRRRAARQWRRPRRDAACRAWIGVRGQRRRRRRERCERRPHTGMWATRNAHARDAKMQRARAMRRCGSRRAGTQAAIRCRASNQHRKRTSGRVGAASAAKLRRRAHS
jgi:hypothetical protein